MPPKLLLTISFTATILAACQGGPVRQAATLGGFATTPRESADFVREKRPESTDYIPIGAAPPPRAPAKPQDRVKNVEGELDALRAANEARAAQAKSLGSTPAPAPVRAPTN